MRDYGLISSGQLVWYPFCDNADILIIVNTRENKIPFIANTTCHVNVYDINNDMLEYPKRSYDYIILMDVLRFYSKLKEVFLEFASFLKEEGIFLVITDNKFGLKFLCGTPDFSTDIPFGGIQAESGTGKGKRYDRHTLLSTLRNCGFASVKFYYPLPDYEVTQVIYTDNILPKEDLEEKVIFHFEEPESLVMDERKLYADIIKNGVFPFFSNSFIIECCKESGFLCDVDYAAVSFDRSKENAFITSIHQNGIVTKKPAFREGISKIYNLQSNMNYLASKGIHVLDAEYRDDGIKMKYITAPTLSNYIRMLFKQKESAKIVEVFVQLYDKILRSSEHIAENKNQIKDKYDKIEWGVILERAYVELIPLNCFWQNGGFLFFDQEFYIEAYPALFIMYRALRYTYKCIPGMSSVVTLTSLRERFGITDRMWEAFQVEEQIFLANIKQRKRHEDFYQHVILNEEMLKKNVRRLNIERYVRHHRNVLMNRDKKVLILFGTGKFAQKYIEKYGSYYPPQILIDNNTCLWGTKKWGIEICPPQTILTVEQEKREVIICTNYNNYTEIKRQLEFMGVQEYVHFDAEKDYIGCTGRDK